MGVAQKYAALDIDEARFSDELHAIKMASVVSSPSYGMINELRNRIDLRHAIVNKNPISIAPKSLGEAHRDIDVLYMGRFDVLKGVNVIADILTRLPRHFRVGLVGKGATGFAPPTSINVVLRAEHIDSEERYSVIARSRSVIVPSKFENCSMMILEALAHCVPIVAWDVGGNAEIPADVVKTVRYLDFRSFASAVVETVSRPLPTHRFEAVVAYLNHDFLNGISAIVRSQCLSSCRYKSQFVRTAPSSGKSILSRLVR
jgi:glycosyltransferase involved in cell wall biosynthesis